MCSAVVTNQGWETKEQHRTKDLRMYHAASAKGGRLWFQLARSDTSFSNTLHADGGRTRSTHMDTHMKIRGPSF